MTVLVCASLMQVIQGNDVQMRPDPLSTPAMTWATRMTSLALEAIDDVGSSTDEH